MLRRRVGCSTGSGGGREIRAVVRDGDIFRVLHDVRVVVLDDVIREVAALHSLPSSPVVWLRGLGSVNHVCCLGSGGERCVVRTPMDELRQHEFEIEHWCLEQAAIHGIASPQVVGRGDVSGTPYIVLTFVDASPVDEHDLAAWETLGRYGRLAHGFDWRSGPDALFTRFGRDPDLAWREHLLYNADQLTDTDPLIELGVYPASEQPRIRDSVAGLLAYDFTHGLRHGDLAPRNLLRPSHGPPVLLDWGQANVGPIPYGDLLDAFRSHVAEGHPTAAEIEVFSAALGEPLSALQEMLEDLVVLRALDRVRWALDSRPDRLAGLVRDARDALCT